MVHGNKNKVNIVCPIFNLSLFPQIVSIAFFFIAAILRPCVAQSSDAAATTTKSQKEWFQQVDALYSDTTHLYELQYGVEAKKYLDAHPEIKAKKIGEATWDLTESTREVVGSLSLIAKVVIDARKNTITVFGNGMDLSLANGHFWQLKYLSLRQIQEDAP